MPVAMRHAFPKDERRDDDQEVVDYFTYEVTRIKRKEIDSPLRKKKYVYVAGPTHGEMSTRDGTKI